MSIREEWKRFVHEEVRELFELPPLDGDKRPRTVLCSHEIWDVLNQEMEEGDDANRRSRLLATLQNIVAGRRQVVCLVPYAARKANIGLLDPADDGIFDVRCQEKPAVRVFCCFVETDVLLAVTCRPRSKILWWLSWLPLGPRESKEWKRGIAAVKREWDRLFPTYTPVTGGNLRAYLSSNASLERTRSRP
jgi:hypothetical protein